MSSPTSRTITDRPPADTADTGEPAHQQPGRQEQLEMLAAQALALLRAVNQGMGDGAQSHRAERDTGTASAEL
ncbi:hypothetical protein PZ897_17290 [Hoeflea sp. YIM 152468]|uniref:hypothetical protein n=1 Tax=Hoeflea sp. YIM 152468 TaxID=3031759 RepID=UPI0023DC9520|nr:hypothetical protein [Hoeflea sp. YIM 152468]MDF1609938.1 hypothetical protein [Hoeflea sp. YIM 152468]